ncbi:MAG: hypothetical protein DMG79_01840 [Acidobacteria bacterium]|nr:MAG: hypothetical protein DMG79_01840 [Acidobacteriota bacterium]
MVVTIDIGSSQQIETDGRRSITISISSLPNTTFSVQLSSRPVTPLRTNGMPTVSDTTIVSIKVWLRSRPWPALTSREHDTCPNTLVSAKVRSRHRALPENFAFIIRGFGWREMQG